MIVYNWNMLGRRLFLLVVVICSLLMPNFSMAQLTAKQAFKNAPRQVFPLLDELTRLDMLDYYESGSKTSSKNLSGGGCSIMELSTNQLKLRMTDVSTYSINTVKSKGDSVIIVIATLKIPAEDSYISFYDKDWTPLTGKRFVPPTLKQWMSTDAKPLMEDIENAVPFVSCRYDFEPETGLLTLTPTLKELIGVEGYGLVEKYLKPQILYRWDGKKMKMVK